MADIDGMFYQVRVCPGDCDYLRFLWWPDGNLSKDPEEYQMSVHLFRGASSPSCANYALKKTAEDNKEDFDAVTVETVKQNFYADDCLRSVATDSKAIRLVGQLHDLLSRGGFRLTKWISNSKQVVNSIPEPERAPSIRDLDFEENVVLTERALGVQWNVHEDSPQEEEYFQSSVQSTIHLVLSPCILLAKLIQQDLCRRKFGWDEPVPESSNRKWEAWLQDLPKLERFKIPRCFRPPYFAEVQQSKLHHFADASD